MKDLAMRATYDIFEKFPDGSTLWRACVHGRYAAQRKIHELAEHSENQIVAIEIPVKEPLPSNVTSESRPAAEAAAN
jgi:hypothetical protein